MLTKSDISLDLALATVMCHRMFGKIPDFSQVRVPEPPDDRQYIAVPNMREIVEYTGGSPKEGLFQAGKKLFPCWKWTDESLDTAIPSEKDERRIEDGSYVVLMLDSERPDDDLMNCSGDGIREMKIPTSTHPEYAIFSKLYFLKHGYHPDRKTWTNNTGSRARNGFVPGGGWGGDASGVSWAELASCDLDLGSRRVWP